jgi:hypothetical protein
MKKLFLYLIMGSAGLLSACNGADDSPEGQNQKEYTFCECIMPADSIKTACLTQFPLPATSEDSVSYNQAYYECTGEFAFSTSADAQIIEEAMEEYVNDLSLEIKELPEEKEDPISDECKQLLEEYADAIKSYTNLMDKLEKNPDDINLLISRGSEEEELYSFSSKPLTFQCSKNKAFKKQMEILNGKRDKLLSN